MNMLFCDRADQIKEVVLTGHPLSLAEFVAVVRFGAKVSFAPSYEENVNKGQRKLQGILDSDKAVYAINTGFGDNCKIRISNDELAQLQENILRSHAVSVGDAMPEEQVRGMILTSLIKAGYGYSCMRLSICELQKEFLNQGMIPYVPYEGTVGGLSYMPYAALTVMGEGRFWKDGKLVPAAQMLKERGLEPIRPHAKEGFAIMNTMTPANAPTLLAVYDLIDTLRHSLVCASLTCEALRCTDKAFDERLLGVKKHSEAIEIGTWMRNALRGSEIMEHARESKVQDVTAVRLIPHIFGAVNRQLKATYEAAMEEFGSAVDNPIILDDGIALMGSSWDTTYTAIACDAMAMAIAQIAKDVAVFMDRLVDAKLSGLPPFLVKKPGVNNGYMIVQYVTTGLNADIAYLSNPISSVTTTVSAGQEAPNMRSDMAARKLLKISEKFRNIINLTILTAAQAIDFLDGSMSPMNQELYSEIRRTVSFMEEDDRIYERIEEVRRIMDSGKLLGICEKHVGCFPI